jgi:hypothetical protein
MENHNQEEKATIHAVDIRVQWWADGEVDRSNDWVDIEMLKRQYKGPWVSEWIYANFNKKIPTTVGVRQEPHDEDSHISSWKPEASLWIVMFDLIRPVSQVFTV